MGGGSSGSSGSGAFSRQGTTQSAQGYTLGGDLANLFAQNNSQPALDPKVKTRMLDMLCANDVPPGYGAMKNAATKDIWSNAYEQDTDDLFKNRVEKALVLARGGMENVIAPMNRGQFFRESEVISQAARERGDELRRQRLADGQMVLGFNDLLHKNALSAAQALAGMQTAQTDALTRSAPFLSSMSNVVTENLAGTGNQNASSAGWGMSCCFIFMEAFNGPLPEYVRQCRDEFCTPKRRDGYIRMSRWLVPAMRVSKTIRKLTNLFLIQPCLVYGNWYKKHNKNTLSYHLGWLAKPIVWFWFKVWDCIGKKV